MHQIPLTDQRSWSSIPEGHFPVFLSAVRTDILLDPDTGSPATNSTVIPVLDSLSDALQYAEEAVQRVPTARADIYDHHARAGDPLRRIYPVALRRRYDPLRRARRDTWGGSILLGAFAIWSVFAIGGSNQHFLWFYMVGMKMLVLGSIFFIRGVGYFLDNRAR